MTEDDEDRAQFSVCQFFADERWEYVARNIKAEEAVRIAKSYTDRPAAVMGIIKRVIITDGGDLTCFEWKFGEGVTYPKNDGKRFVGDT